MRNYGKLLPVFAIAMIVAGAVGLGPIAVRQFAYAAETGQRQADLKALETLSKQDRTSTLFRTVAKTVKPAVVIVKVKQKVDYQSMPFPPMDDFLKRFFEDQQPGPFGFHREGPSPTRPRQHLYRFGIGSGVIVDADKGYVLTNWHVVRDADNIVVIDNNDRQFDAQWVRTDKQTDLAIIKIKPDHLISASLGDSDLMEPGDQVLAIGAPEGLPQTVTAGIISAKGRTTGRGGYQNFLQTDAAINHGNSGGPLVNMRGEVIGINTAIVSRSGGNMGIGLAIPSNMVKRIMRQLVDKGRVVRGYLGVVIQNVDDKLAKSFNLPDTHGALVASVAKDTPAKAAGLKEGDFIVAVGDRVVKNVNDLRNYIAQIRPGKSVTLAIWRNGKKDSVAVKIGQQPENMAAAFGMSGYGPAGGQATKRYGLKVATMDEQYARKFGYDKVPTGVVILQINPDYPAAQSGLAPGDVITNVQGKKVGSAGQFAAAISGDHAAAGVRLRVLDPNGGVRFVFITPKKKN